MPASQFGSEHPSGAIRLVDETHHIVAVCLEGDLDRTNAAALDAAIDRALQSGNHLILDMSEASFSSTPASSNLSYALRSRREEHTKPSCFNSALQRSSSASSKSSRSKKCFPAPTTARRRCE
jgi:STAS domain-containing protein